MKLQKLNTSTHTETRYGGSIVKWIAGVKGNQYLSPRGAFKYHIRQLGLESILIVCTWDTKRQAEEACRTFNGYLRKYFAHLVKCGGLQLARPVKVKISFEEVK